MRLTNSTGLPDTIVSAVKSMIQPPVGGNTIRVSTLISPPIVHQLKLRHWDELEEDVVDNTWRLLGSSLHKLVESLSDGEVTERKISREIDGVKITGTADVKHKEEINDYKVTSVWHKVFSDGLPSSWHKQLNTYAYLFGGIKCAKIVVIYRDWQESKSKDADYPQKQMVAYNVLLAPEEEQLQFIKERIKLHLEAQNLPDDQLPVCSPEDRWTSKDAWAVYKNENKTALRVVGSQEEAEKIIENMKNVKLKGEYKVVKRVGIDKKCLNHCPVSKFCHYRKGLDVQVQDTQMGDSPSNG